MGNIVAKLQEVVMANQSATAIGGDDPVDFGALWSQTDRFAGGLQDREITAGDTVALHLTDARAFLLAFFGTLRNGCVPVAIPTGVDPNGVVEGVETVGARALVTDVDRILGVLNRAKSLRVAVVVGREARMGVDLSTFLENDGMNSAGSRTGIDVVRQSDEDLALIAFVDRADRIPSVEQSRIPAARLEGIGFDHAALAAATAHGQSIGSEDAHLGALPISSPLELGFGAVAAILAGGRYDPVDPSDPERVRARCVTGDATRTILTREQVDAVGSLEGTPTEQFVLKPLSTMPVDRLAVSASSDERPDTLEGGTDQWLYGDPATGITHASGSAIEHRSDDLRPTTDRAVQQFPKVDTRSVRTDRGPELAVASPAGTTKRVTVGEADATRVDAVDGTTWIRPGITLDVPLEGADAETVGRHVE